MTNQTTRPLAEQTAVEIDTAQYQAYVKIADIHAQRDRVQRLIDIIDETEPGSYYSKLPERSPQRRAELAAELEKHEEASTRVYVDEVLPRESEWERRGRWPRYYLVDNTNGHVHKDQDCKTCFPDTRYAWLVEQSGMSAEDLVALAGEKACTVCFPWAPVDVLKQRTKLESPERKAARLERERAKAEREAKKAAKAIADADGSPLKVFTRHYPEREVMRGGKVIRTIPAHDGYDTLATLYAARGWLTDQYVAWRGGETHRDVFKVADAIAAKEGKTRDQVIAEAQQRAARRR